MATSSKTILLRVRLSLLSPIFFVKKSFTFFSIFFFWQSVTCHLFCRPTPFFNIVDHGRLIASICFGNNSAKETKSATVVNKSPFGIISLIFPVVSFSMRAQQSEGQATTKSPTPLFFFCNFLSCCLSLFVIYLIIYMLCTVRLAYKSRIQKIKM